MFPLQTEAAVVHDSSHAVLNSRILRPGQSACPLSVLQQFVVFRPECSGVDVVIAVGLFVQHLLLHSVSLY